MTLHARVSGVWQEITQPSARVSGVWQPLTEGWVRVSGVWQQFFAAGTVAITNQTIFEQEPEPSPVISSYTLKSDGTVVRGGVTFIEDWFTPAPPSTPANYECRASVVSGSGATFTNGMSTWVALSSDREVKLEWPFGAGTGYGERVLTVEIRNASTLSVLSTATITLQADKI
jgi:hypothetical protein